MSYYKFVTLFTILVFSHISSFAHGPSRQKVVESIEINASIEDVWNVISDFQNFQWNKNIKKSFAKSNEIGSERLITFKSGENIKQKLEKINKEKMMVSWRVIDTNDKILPVNSYAAKIFLKSDKDKTIVQYKTGFYRGFMGNDPPPELNDENSKKLVKIFITENLKGLKKIIEKN